MMYGESCVVRNGGTVYYLHYYSRAELQEENQPVWDKILDSVRWQKGA
jgi:hypothetical protein